MPQLTHVSSAIFLHVYFYFLYNFKGYTSFTVITNIGYIPCVVQYILVAYLTPNNLYLPFPHPYFAPLPFPLPTGNY